MKSFQIMAGARVRVRHKHAAYEGAGTWGIVRERHGKQILVVYDGAKRARSERVADVVEAVSPIFSPDEMRAIRAAIMGDRISLAAMNGVILRIDALLATHRADDKRGGT